MQLLIVAYFVLNFYLYKKKMSRKEKLLLRFLSQPKDFTFDEAVKLLNDFGFYEANTGKTSGSAVRFESLKYPDIRIRFHKPHPNKILKSYVSKFK